MSRPAFRSSSRGVLPIALLALAGAVETCCAAPAPAPPPPGKEFVWRVTDLPVPFYLVGSMHNLRARDYPLPRAYGEALSNSQRLVFEYDPRERAAFARKFREVARYPDGETIEDHLSPVTLALLKKNAWRFRTRLERMRRYRPWAIALQLLAERGPMGAGNPRSMDARLSAEARRAGKEVAGLETADEHVAFWREMLERDGESLLRYALTRERAVGDLLDRTRDAWKRGDVAALAAANARLHRVNPGIAQKLLDRRNAPLGGADRSGNENRETDCDHRGGGTFFRSGKRARAAAQTRPPHRAALKDGLSIARFVRGKGCKFGLPNFEWPC